MLKSDWKQLRALVLEIKRRKHVRQSNAVIRCFDESFSLTTTAFTTVVPALLISRRFGVTYYQVLSLLGTRSVYN